MVALLKFKVILDGLLLILSVLSSCDGMSMNNTAKIEQSKNNACNPNKNWLTDNQCNRTGEDLGYCYYDPNTSLYKSCHILCDPGGMTPSREQRCHYYCKDYNGYKQCNLTLAMTNPTVLLITIIPSVTGVTFLIVGMLTICACCRKRSNHCCYCKGQLNCWLCRNMADRIWCKSFKIRSVEPTIDGDGTQRRLQLHTASNETASVTSSAQTLLTAEQLPLPVPPEDDD